MCVISFCKMTGPVARKKPRFLTLHDLALCFWHPKDTGFLCKEVVDTAVFEGVRDLKPGTPEFHQDRISKLMIVSFFQECIKFTTSNVKKTVVGHVFSIRFPCWILCKGWFCVRFFGSFTIGVRWRWQGCCKVNQRWTGRHIFGGDCADLQGRGASGGYCLAFCCQNVSRWWCLTITHVMERIEVYDT